MPRTVAELVVRDVPLLRTTQDVGSAVETVLGSGLPALPVVDDEDRLAGIFGEREFMEAVFPGYVRSLSGASFVPRSLESALEKRQKCRVEEVRKHMNDERIRVHRDFSDLQLAETFIHHRVLIVPVTEQKRVVGVVTRSDFFRAVAERFLGIESA